LVPLLVSIAAACIYVMALQQDLTRRRIPNSLSLGILALAAVKWIAVGRVEPVLWAALAGIIVFVVTAFFFWRGWMGGGDVKLLSTTSFLVGGGDTYGFLFMTALVGGVVSIVVLAIRLFSWYRERQGPRVGNDVGAKVATAAVQMSVPYGVAISIAALWVLFCQFR